LAEDLGASPSRSSAIFTWRHGFCSKLAMATETDLEAANRRIADGTRRIADSKAYIEKQAERPTDEARGSS
jgi:hypothetical protein